MALSPSREPAVWAGVGMTCGFIQQVFNNPLLVTSVSSGSASSHANFWEPTPWKVKIKREWVTPVRKILSFQRSLNFGGDAFAWERCWLSTKVGRKREGRLWRRVCASLFNVGLTPTSPASTLCNYIPSPCPHAHMLTHHNTVYCGNLKKKKKEPWHKAWDVFQFHIRLFTLIALQFIFTYVSACASVWVAATCMQIRLRGQKAVSDHMAMRAMGTEWGAGNRTWVIGTECGIGN